MFRSRRSSSSSSRICACTVTSRAVVGFVGDDEFRTSRDLPSRSGCVGACHRRAGAGSRRPGWPAPGCRPGRAVRRRPRLGLACGTAVGGARNSSPSWSPMDSTGFSADSASWNTMCSSARPSTSRRCRSPKVSRSVPAEADAASAERWRCGPAAPSTLVPLRTCRSPIPQAGQRVLRGRRPGRGRRRRAPARVGWRGDGEPRTATRYRRVDPSVTSQLTKWARASPEVLDLASSHARSFF